MCSLVVGRRATGFEALSYADTESGATTFAPDSYVLVLDDGSSVTITSGTDWTLQIEPGTWPRLPEWAQPPESWRFENVDSPIGAPGLDVIRALSYLHNEVGEVAGIEISFEGGTVRLMAGASVSCKLRTR